MGVDVRSIKVSAIRENPVALRSVDVEGEGYIGLRDSIARRGLLTSLSVRSRVEDVDGEVVEYFEIVDGLHRYTAAVDLGLDEVPAIVVDLDKTETLEAQIMANIQKIETTPIEYTKQLQRIFSFNPTMTVTDMAARVARSTTWVQQRLNLLKLNPDVQKLVDDGKISVANAVALAKLPANEQPNYVDSAITMNTDEFAPVVQTRAKELKDAAREGRKAKPVEFTPITKLRRLSELKSELDSPVVAPELCKELSTPVEGFLAGVAWASYADSLSVAAQKAAYEEKIKIADDAKAKRAAERAKKKAEEAADAAAKAAEAAGL
jgi:ParB family chromosome partitioning protein